jgi:hypothetical protein
MEHAQNVLESKMTARDREEHLLACRAAVAQGVEFRARDRREVNVFHVAAMILGQDLQRQARHLEQASEHYFREYPHDKLEPAEVIRQGWIIGLPRLRDMLTRKIQGRT